MGRRREKGVILRTPVRFSPQIDSRQINKIEKKMGSRADMGAGGGGKKAYELFATMDTQSETSGLG